MTECSSCRPFHPLLSRFTPLFLFRRIASVSARPFSRLPCYPRNFSLFSPPLCSCLHAVPVRFVTLQLLYEPVTSPNGATSLLLISFRRALFRGRARPSVLPPFVTYWLFPLRCENADCFADAISVAARVGECRTLTCFRISIREG